MLSLGWYYLSRVEVHGRSVLYSPSACVTYERFESQSDTASFYSYDCGPTSTVITALANPVVNGTILPTASQPTETSQPSQSLKADGGLSTEAVSVIASTSVSGGIAIIGIIVGVCSQLWPLQTKKFFCFIYDYRRRRRDNHVILRHLNNE
jgi:hypothetical protein